MLADRIAKLETMKQQVITTYTQTMAELNAELASLKNLTFEPLELSPHMTIYYKHICDTSHSIMKYTGVLPKILLTDEIIYYEGYQGEICYRCVGPLVMDRQPVYDDNLIQCCKDIVAQSIRVENSQGHELSQTFSYEVAP